MCPLGERAGDKWRLNQGGIACLTRYGGRGPRLFADDLEGEGGELALGGLGVDGFEDSQIAQVHIGLGVHGDEIYGRALGVHADDASLHVQDRYSLLLAHQVHSEVAALPGLEGQVPYQVETFVAQVTVLHVQQASARGLHIDAGTEVHVSAAAAVGGVHGNLEQGFRGNFIII